MLQPAVPTIATAASLRQQTDDLCDRLNAALEGMRHQVEQSRMRVQESRRLLAGAAARLVDGEVPE